jgi:hypothetical protein
MVFVFLLFLLVFLSVQYNTHNTKVHTLGRIRTPKQASKHPQAYALDSVAMGLA